MNIRFEKEFKGEKIGLPKNAVVIPENIQTELLESKI
jgi:hypothetical protein